MRFSSACVAPLLAALAGCAQLSGMPMDVSDNHSDLRAAEKDLARALESSDPTAWVYHYTEDAIFVAPAAPAIQGRKELLQMAKKMRPLSSVVIVPIHTEASGNVAAVYGRASWVSGAQGTSPTMTNVRLILVWRKEPDGRWRVAEELLHAEPPPK